jgi:hypothetical protein
VLVIEDECWVCSLHLGVMLAGEDARQTGAPLLANPIAWRESSVKRGLDALATVLCYAQLWDVGRSKQGVREPDLPGVRPCVNWASMIDGMGSALFVLKFPRE